MHSRDMNGHGRRWEWKGRDPWNGNWVWMARGMTRPSRLEFETPSDLEVVHFHEAIFWPADIFLVDTVARIYFRHTYAICISSYHSHSLFRVCQSFLLVRPLLRPFDCRFSCHATEKLQIRHIKFDPLTRCALSWHIIHIPHSHLRHGSRRVR